MKNFLIKLRAPYGRALEYSMQGVYTGLIKDINRWTGFPSEFERRCIFFEMFEMFKACKLEIRQFFFPF